MRRQRKALDLTQPDLADLVGCSVSVIAKLEKNERKPSRQLAERLAQYLELAAEERDAFVQLARLSQPATVAAAAPAATPAAPPRPASVAPPSNLPAPPSPFIGREQELAALLELLGQPDVRLVTLIGPGGTGKTRLGVRTARLLVERGQHGVYFVALAQIADPALVPGTIAQIFGLKEESGITPLQQLKAYLRGRRVLLLLDNFEHVVAAAPVVGELLYELPELRVLVTSRIALRLYGEQLFDVPPLMLPDLGSLPAFEQLARCESLELFAARARAAKRSFTLSPENAPAVAEICSRLDGLPLAIELAAAQTRIFTPGELLAQLESRLHMLGNGPHDLAPRHQTLRDTIAWSYQLLGEPQQQLFMRLGVFMGGCTGAAAEAILAGAGAAVARPGPAAMRLLASLVDHSLLRSQPAPDGCTRFVMLETIREYALERLDEGGDTAQLRQRHARYYQELAERLEPELTGPRQKMLMDCLEQEHDNMRAALEWSCGGDPEMGLRLATALWLFWCVRGHWGEGRRWFERLLTAGASAAPLAQAAARSRAAVIAWFQGDYDQSAQLSAQSLEVCRAYDDRKGIMYAVGMHGIVSLYQGDAQRARGMLSESLALARDLGERWMQACVLRAFGLVELHRGAGEQAITLYEEGLALCRQLEDKVGITMALIGLERAVLLTGDHERAVPLCQECLELASELGDKQSMAMAYLGLGQAHLLRRDAPQSLAFNQQALAIFEELGDKRGMAMALTGMGQAALLMGDAETARPLYQRNLPLCAAVGDRLLISWAVEGLAALSEDRAAVVLLGAAAVLRESIGARRAPAEQALHEQLVATARDRLGEPGYALAWQEGQTLDLGQLLALAQTLA